MLTTGMVAIDSTILATAIPSIVADLGGFAQFPWLFSIYLLAQAVTVPVYAKLSDVIGRKPVLLFGIGLFLLGSVLCGLAWNMPALILFRCLQGLGAGSVQPMAVTIAGDIYTVAERAKVQGYLASVWAVSAVAGPTLGGVFSQFLSWRWIFYVNVPVCLLAAWMLLRVFHEVIEHSRRRIDYTGAALLTVSLSLLILGVLEGGQAWAWDSPQSIGSFVAGGVLLGVFLIVERRASDPVLPLWVLSRRLLLTTTLVALGAGAIVIGLTSYIPTYLEGTLGVAPVVSGLSLAALSIGWPLAASLSGRLYLRIGFRHTVIVGTGTVVIGAALLSSFTFAPAIALVTLSGFIVGLGLGFSATPSLIAAQASVPWNQRGVVTGMNQFARSMGSALGVAVLGAIANAVIASSGGQSAPAIENASFGVFIAVVLIALATLAAALAMPRTPAKADAVEGTEA